MSSNEAESGRSVTRRIASILATFSDTQERSSAEIARLTGLPVSTAYRLTSDLVAADLLERTASGAYRVGSALRTLAASEPRPASLFERVRPALDDLSSIVNGLSRCGILEGSDVVYVERAPGRPPEPPDPERAPAHWTALGRAILAFAPEPLVEHVIARGFRAHNGRSGTSPERLRRTLAVIRQTHVALVNCPDFRSDQFSVAMPVFGPGGGVIAALELSVSDLIHELPRSLAALELCSRALSRELAAPHPVARRFSTAARTSDLQMAAILGAFQRQRPLHDTGMGR